MVETRDLGPDDAPALTDLYGEYGWWTEREVDGVRAALAETAVAVGVEVDGELVAAARVFTDYTYYATVFDVVVTADRRREGFGRELMAAVRDHPDLRDRGRDGSRDRSGDGPTVTRSPASRCSVGRGSFRSTSRSASSGSTRRWRYRRAAPSGWSG